MGKSKNIHSLDSLEREIYRLRLEAKNIEKKIDHNLEHLQESFSSMAMNSFFRKKKTTEAEKDSFFGSFLKNEKLNAAFNKITDHIADRAAEVIDQLIDKFFHKKKHHSDE
jgi:F0F1-type ATP synthase delta subunit